MINKRNKHMKQIINLTESIINRIVKQTINEIITKSKKEQMLNDLFNYLSKEPTDDIYDNGNHINTSYKAYNYFEPKGIVHNVWAVHYTDVTSYEDIRNRGFMVGIHDYDALAYSGNYYDRAKNKESGWNFALPIDNKYLGEDCGYGDCGFLIKTDGVRAYHKIDGDDEIIFQNCMVTQKIPFVYDEDYECYILTDGSDICKDGHLPKGAYYDGELERVVFEDVHSLIKFVISRYSNTTSI